ncbi:flagellar basal-body MS-ring/collar protein FliF [Noviherbaspirillum pedocola]|uniref:Flagellar M-ring protein n=1 Tax=Noviherbaspirillum pedocola TaxID=2801341 RepID=A0A934SV29_9BURK|nr:flagellar basal-body MS-ring/collar protein FliF [Noviherbaspirillum pedocola]MBK4735696.1 flagellar M-ring protein FliF [Noviherbaspirillum pedocola]
MLEPLKQTLKSLGNGARLLLLLAAAVSLAAALAFGWKLLSPDYQVLFSDLDPQDAGAIVAELDRIKVPHRLGDEGRTILVDRDEVYRTRLKLMSKGVNLRGTVGFELFNESDIGMTEFAQKINYQRAMQGELARTIMGLEEVQSARVHLALPETGLLRRGDGQGKASVTITARPGMQLHAPQVLGIQRLVAAAVPQVEPGAVTVTDSRGVTLSAASDNTGAERGGSGDAVLELKRQTEAYFISKAAAVLDRAVGPGRAIVMVDAILNPDMLKVTEEKVLVVPGGSGDGAVLRSKQTTMADSRARAPTTQSSESATGAGRETTLSEVEFQHGRRVEQIVSAPGAIKRLSVGVVLPAAMSEAQSRKLTEVVSMAVGLNPTRGDAIAAYSLEALPASHGEAGAAAATGTVAQLTPPHADAAAVTATKAATLSAAPLDAKPVAIKSAGLLSALSASTTWMITGTVAAALLLVSLGLAMRRGRRAQAPARLSDQERARMLRELNAWLAPRPPGAPR